MPLATLKRSLHGPLPVALLLLLLMVGLHLMSSAVQNTAELNRLFVPLLVAVVIGLLALIALVVVNVVQLVVRYRRQAAGSRLTLRLAGTFVILAMLPVGVLYYYSQQFLLHGIDSWFNLRIDQAMQDALDLSQASMDLHKRAQLKATQKLFAEVSGSSQAGLSLSLGELREEYGALELSLMDGSGKVITSSNIDPSILVPEEPDYSILQQVRDGSSFVGLMPQGPDGLLQVRVVLADRGRGLIVQAIYPTSASIAGLAEKVEDAYNLYRELSYLREQLKSTFTHALAALLLFTLLSAIWAAFYAARRLVAPIAAIAEATQAVAEGHYDRQVPLPRSHDELGFLVSLFNTMTRRLAQARDATECSRHELEAQRAYLETVLGRLSSGVITFDARLQLRTANPAALAILHLVEPPPPGVGLDDLASRSQGLEELVDAVREPLRRGVEWSEQVTLFGAEGRQVLLCRVTPLPMTEPASCGGSPEGGQVLVFDDITALIQAQRNAAWGEAARRLAHEIKNPLTPIQLSAERLRHKLLPKVAPEDSEMLDRATRTIVQQVEAMKEMVNAFSDYARPPKLNPRPLVLDELVAEVLELYRNSGPHVRVRQALASAPAAVDADPIRLRQVIHNLVKNAQEAMGERGQPGPEGESAGEIRVETECSTHDDWHYVELRVLDQGAGIPAELLGQLFEPYFTTKARGSGLGLAIVKRIVEEHGGTIRAENRAEGGAGVILRLPQLRHGRQGATS